MRGQPLDFGHLNRITPIVNLNPYIAFFDICLCDFMWLINI